MADLVDLNQPWTTDELADHDTRLTGVLSQIDAEFAGKGMPAERRQEFADVTENREAVRKLATELNQRKAIVERAAAAGHIEPTSTPVADLMRGAPKGSTADANIFDMNQYRTDYSNPGRSTQAVVDGARRAIEGARFPHPDYLGKREQVQAGLEDLLDTIDYPEALARHILATGSPTYRTAFGKAMLGVPLFDSESRALAVARALSLTGASGGFAVPFTLDPTVLGTSNSSVNPYRAIARVEQITVDEWRGVTSGAITAAYATEAAETTDNAPTLAQPTISTERAQAFIPFSIEIGMDWPGLERSMSILLQEAKDDLEADKFTAGSGTNEPFGFITGATNTVNATTGQTFDAEDLYRLEGALPPRYRPRASIVGNRAIYSLTRQFDTQGGSALWMRLGEGLPNNPDGRLGQGLLGYPTFEASAMASTAATGNKFLALGDFTRFVIVDRIGLTVETIQHLVGTNHRPTGQRGLFAYWRNSSKVVDANAFRVLIGIA